MGTTLIHFPKSQFLDPTTGRPSREWIQWLQSPNVIKLTIGGGGALDVADGGTGLINIPEVDQILIGTGEGYILGSVGSILPAFSGDATTEFGHTTITFAAVNSSPGVFGAANKTLTVIVNGKGLVTSIVSTNIAINSSAVSGTNTNDDAAAGIIGEYLSNTLLVGAALPLTTIIPLNIVSLSLMAGDWDVSGVIAFKGSGITNVSYYQSSISITSNAIGTLGQYITIADTAVIAIDQSFSTPICRILLAATTTIYLVANASFSVSTLSAYGFIRARRVR